MKPNRTTFTLALTLAALLVLPLVAQAGHWPNFGGDAGHSGNQPVDAAKMAVQFQARFGEAGEDRTSVVVTGGDAQAGRRVAYGRHVDVPGSDDDQTLVHIRDLATGNEIVPAGEQAIDDDSGASQTDDETLGDAGSDEFVTPVSSSPEGGLGQLFVVHNDEDSAAAQDNGCPTGGGRSTASRNDIAIAQFDESTGAQVQDVAVGQAAGNDATVPAGLCPTAGRPQVTDGYRVDGPPVLTPPLDAEGRRLLFFTARNVTGTTGRLFRLEIGNAGSADATLTDVTAPQFRDIPNLNTKLSPAIAYLRDPATGRVAPYVVVGVNATPGASDVRAFKAEDIGTGEVDLEVPSDRPGHPVAISVPSTELGKLPNQATGDVKAPAIYVSYADGELTSVRKFAQAGAQETLDEVAASPALDGVAGPGLALSTVVSGGQEQAGRVVVTTGRNLFVLDKDSLQVVERLADTGEALLEAGVTGFRRNAPLHSGGFVFVQDDSGTPFVLDLATADPVAASDFSPDATHLESVRALGQPAYADGVLLFSTDRGLFRYATGVATPPNEAPVARLTATPNPGAPDQPVTLDASGTTDPEGLGIARYEWDLDGNGTFEVDSGSRSQTTATFRTAGSHVVHLRVTDVPPARAAARTGIATQTVVISPAPANRPPVATRATPRISAKVTPSRDGRLPFVFKTTGRVTLPKGVTRTSGCRGRVSVTVKAGKRTISRRTTALGKRCTYTSKVTFRDRKRIGSKQSLRFTARFQGNDALVARQAKTVTVRLR